MRYRNPDNKREEKKNICMCRDKRKFIHRNVNEWIKKGSDYTAQFIPRTMGACLMDILWPYHVSFCLLHSLIGILKRYETFRATMMTKYLVERE